MAVRARHANDYRCETCGFDRAVLSPAHAATAARDLARHWRELFDRAVVEGAELLQRGAESGWSIVDHAAHVAEVLDRNGIAVAAIRDHHLPSLEEVGIEVPRAGNAGADIGDIVADVSAAAEIFARTVESLSVDDWARPGIRRGALVTAGDLAHHAIHEDMHHFSAASEVFAMAATDVDKEDSVAHSRRREAEQ